MGCHYLYQVWTVLLASIFLVATTGPHVGTVGHSHHGGDTAHQHLNLTALSGSRQLQSASQHLHTHHQAFQALPFGGYYAHAESRSEIALLEARDSLDR